MIVVHPPTSTIDGALVLVEACGKHLSSSDTEPLIVQSRPLDISSVVLSASTPDGAVRSVRIRVIADELCRITLIEPWGEVDVEGVSLLVGRGT